jgi:hypothetical protein
MARDTIRSSFAAPVMDSNTILKLGNCRSDKETRERRRAE